MKTLYQLTDQLSEVLTRINADGEIPPGLMDELDAVSLDFTSKVDGVLRARVNCVAQVEGIDVEIKRLTALRDAAARRAEWLRNYVHRAMLATGQTKLTTALFRVWIQNNGRPSIKLADGEAVPPELAKVVVTTTLDTEAAYERWRAWQAEYQAAVDNVEMDAATAEEHAKRAAELELPSSVRVVEGSHLRIK